MGSYLGAQQTEQTASRERAIALCVVEFADTAFGHPSVTPRVTEVYTCRERTPGFMSQRGVYVCTAACPHLKPIPSQD